LGSRLRFSPSAIKRGNIMKRIFGSIILVVFTLAPFKNDLWSEEFIVSTASQLQSALTTAETNGESDVIKLIQGSYKGNFTYDSSEGNDIELLGGYILAGADRELNPSNTILDGLVLGRTLYLHNQSGGHIRVEGITVKNGLTSGDGGGVYARSYTSSGLSGNIVLAHNVISNNTSNGYGGGGVYAVSYSYSGTPGEVNLEHNLIKGNTCKQNGGGVMALSYAVFGTARIVELTYNIIKENVATDEFGGGVFASSWSSNGQAQDVILVNNIISKNSSNKAAGLNVYMIGTSSRITLTNNTIIGNTASNYGGGLRKYMNDASGDLRVYNNIIWGNTATFGDDIMLEGFGTSSAYNNDYAAMVGSWTNSGGNIDADPLLIDVQWMITV